MKEDEWITERRTPRDSQGLHQRKMMAAKATRIQKKIDGWERAARIARPPFTQTKHFINLFGGIVPFAVAVGVHPEEIIQYWLSDPFVPKKGRPKSSGKSATGGFIPTQYLPRLLKTARAFGILISSEDLYPDFLNEKKTRQGELDRWMRLIKKSQKMRNFEDVLASLASTPV